ncbi:hypothetical protein [Sphingobacterium multivorum]|uniref:hypothetical protein n=1 Tax=Sphingobacterium multivorum TaxID=28454 RepID=UPI0028B021BB|nr:hypothetical protein [Sphingobacterium multivorum]
MGASYIDFFGGRSTSYEKKMQEMYRIRHIVERILPFGSVIVQVPICPALYYRIRELQPERIIASLLTDNRRTRLHFKTYPTLP